MDFWAAVIADEQFATELMYAHESIAIRPAAASAAVSAAAASAAAAVAAPGDRVALVAAVVPPLVFAIGRVTGTDEDGSTVVVYDRPRPDRPSAVPGATLPELTRPGLRPLTKSQFAELIAGLLPPGSAGSVAAAARRSEWFVSLALPIEAATRAEAVREFWTYVATLGPRELPAFVWPRGDEMAMQPFVLGAITNLDPEEEGER